MKFLHTYINATLLAAFLAAGLLGADLAHATEAPAHAEKSPAAAYALLEQRTSDSSEAAWHMLLSLLPHDPTNLDINTLMVRAALATGRTNQAIAAIERLVALRPQDPSLRIELAKAYAHAGDSASARAEMDQVKLLAPELSDDAIEKTLEQAAAAGRNNRDLWQVSGSLSAGFIWDSNVNGGLDNLRLGGGSWLFVMGKDSRRTAGFGEYLNATVNINRRLNRESPWWLVGDVSFYGKFYNETVPSNQYFAWSRASLGVRYSGQRTLLELRGKGELSHHEPYDRMTSVGAEATFLFAVTPTVQLMSKAGIDSRAYATSPGRNGNYWNVGQYLRLIWGTDTHALIGVRFMGGEAKECRNSYAGWEVMARFNFSPITRLTVSPFLAWREQQYRDIPTWLSILLEEGKRFDRSFMAGLSFTWEWTPSLVSELGWQYTRNYSNSTFYKYDQHQINLGLTYKF